MSHLIKIGSRKSTLAKLQSYIVANEIKKLYPDINIEFYFRESMGDKDLSSPLWKMSGRGVFTKEFQEGLVRKDFDMVVHSWKDLELEENPKTKIISVLERADARDILLFKKSYLVNPPEEISIMSSSPRREYNLTEYLQKALPKRLQNKKILFEPVRGNIQTRIKKWKSSETIQGIILAKAALDRLLSEDFPESQTDEFKEIRLFLRKIIRENVFMILPLSENPNAPAQGALAVEVLSDNQKLIRILESLTSNDTAQSVLFERSELKKYGGGCHQKIGVAHRKIERGDYISIRGETDDGEILNVSSLNRSPRQSKSDSIDLLWPQKGEGLRFERNQIPLASIPKGHLWISRSSAWQKSWVQSDYNQIFWCAGVKTLFDLAYMDLWIHGTADGLGESNGEELKYIVGDDVVFRKLTHSKSSEVDSILSRIPTYELNLLDDEIDLSNRKYFFWMSGYQFDLVLEKFPAIKDLYHACGPGITASHLRKRLGENGHLDVFLNYSEWMKYHTRVDTPI